MTSTAQRAELLAKIWKIANEVRGAVDGWDFKQFVLGTLFYRYISENFTNYIEAGDDSIDYASLSDEVITPEIKDDAIKTKGYFIYPSQLYVNIAKTANTNPNLNTDLKAIFTAIESSANGYPSEEDIKGLFADFDTTSSRLGNTVESKNSRLAAVLKGVEELNFGNFEDNKIDLFGDAYEILIGNYAANAGKSGGEFFTPVHVSKLIAQLAMHKQEKVNKIYDPAAGSGSLLLQAKKHFDAHIIEEGFFGQEINHTTYNLARMNMFLHNVNYDKFNIALGDTLHHPHFIDDKPFDAIVSNPPDKATLIEEIRRVIRASIGNRAKESLVVDFINETDLETIQDKANVIDSFFKYAQDKQKKEASELIIEENLNEDEAKRYITASLKREFANENGTELNTILPKMSPLNPQYLTKKQSVFQKISKFVEKFKGVGGQI